ncbi:MAG: hypothetical protein GXY38_06750 [Planctomycetes bacterium]|nr:hypothetical protein [Planctomycetota bacterium]
MNKTSFTLTELVLGMAITAMIGLAVAGASSVLSGSYSSDVQAHQSLQTARIAMLKANDELRRAKLVLFAGDNYFMIWREGDDADDEINISEIITFRHDASQKKLLRHQVVYPPSLHSFWVMLLNYEVPLNTLITSPAYCLSSLLNMLYCQTAVVAEDVQSFSVWTNNSPPRTDHVVIDIVVGKDSGSFHLRNSATLRRPATDQVGRANGEWVLFGD